MRLSSIKLENFRAKETLSLDLGRRITLLIGANGSGKTSVLDAIAIGLGAVLTHLPDVTGISFRKSGDIRQVDNNLQPYVRVALETTTGLKWDRTLRRDKSKATGKLVPPSHGIRELEHFLDETVIDPANLGKEYPLPLFVYYGVSRALLDLPLRRKGFPQKHHRFEALANALNADSRFRSAFIWFYNKENEEHRLQKEHRSFDVSLKELDVVRSAITQLFPDISAPHIELNPLRFVVKQRGETMNIAQLSDGYKTLLGLVIDLSSRMAIANPHMDDPLAAEVVVMIDEIDLHLHPEWQQRVMGDLLRTFSNAQFIVTTHSPYILEALNNHLKRHKVNELLFDDEKINNLLPVCPDDLTAYMMEEQGEQSLMDDEIELLDDKLLEQFNVLNQLYDKMRDREWEQRS
ncbi:AAA family ATPase [bacterium]|nr:AAA family ATPase [bacterium]